MAEALKLFPDFNVIVYLTVEHNVVAPIRRFHWLPSAHGRINDRKSAMEQQDCRLPARLSPFTTALYPHLCEPQPTVIVRSPVLDRLQYRLRAGRLPFVR